MRTRTFPPYGYYQHLLEVHRNALQGVGDIKAKAKALSKYVLNFVLASITFRPSAYKDTLD